MLDLPSIDRVTSEAALATLSRANFIRTLSEHTTDSDGHDAVLVTIVTNSLVDDPDAGDRALDTILRVRHELERAGEERVAIIDFATESEITSHGDA